ncbi:unnamed protein product [Caenorhabditis auriculariae]|uniref:Uncharacterized protein n=1 Tax=Caenorhabditis auriculariae TaxID=2777116 RepID=A0A8S1H5L0_9PELO|nr:unnamed protein product [Caenorhabditis auriculariae]
MFASMRTYYGSRTKDLKPIECRLESIKCLPIESFNILKYVPMILEGRSPFPHVHRLRQMIAPINIHEYSKQLQSLEEMRAHEEFVVRYTEGTRRKAIAKKSWNSFDTDEHFGHHPATSRPPWQTEEDFQKTVHWQLEAEMKTHFFCDGEDEVKAGDSASEHYPKPS